jgi:glycosyltransferase involved in cell wall biosynthesis
MKVSIITVCLNNQDTIADTIRSVNTQNYANIEHIFIDGVSKDGTLTLIQELAPKAIVVSESDKGIYDALNKGIQKASGDIIGMLHADDVYADDDVISKVVEAMKEPNIQAAYGDLVYVRRENVGEIIRYWKSGRYKPNAFLWGWMPPHPTFFVKEAVYQKYGVFNTTLRSAADYELMLRLIHRHAVALNYIPHILVKMRLGGQSNVTFSNRLKANKEDRLAWSMNQLKPYWFTRLIKPLRKIKQFVQKR